jgi:hypothetical protein
VKVSRLFRDRDDLVGPNSADNAVAALEARLAEVRAAGAAASDKITELEGERAAAQTFGEARQLDQRIDETRWQADHAAAELPLLEGRLAEARHNRRRTLVVDYQQRMRALYPEFRAALEAAVAVQQRAQSLYNEAATAVGSNDAQRYVGALAFAGFLSPDHFVRWTAAHDQLFAGAATAPPPYAAPRRPLANPQSPEEVRHAVASLPTEQRLAMPHAPAPKAPPRTTALMPSIKTPDDTAPLAEGEARVQASYPNWPPADDRPACHLGQVVRMPLGDAERASGRGLCKILERFGDPAVSTEAKS